MGISLTIFQKINNIELPYDPAIQLKYIYIFTPKRTESKDSSKNLYMNVPSSTIHNSQKSEKKCLSPDKWVEKIPYKWYLYISLNNGIVFSHEKEWSTDMWYNHERPHTWFPLY